LLLTDQEMIGLKKNAINLFRLSRNRVGSFEIYPLFSYSIGEGGFLRRLASATKCKITTPLTDVHITPLQPDDHR
jgi:hypothetical protein